MEKQDSRYRWLVLFIVLFTYCIIVSQRTAPGLITDQLMEKFTVTASTMGLIASIQFLAYSGLQIPVGLFSDRYGPNLFFISGAMFSGVGTLLYSTAPNAGVLLFSRILVGVGDATIWVCLVLILSQWFRAQEFSNLLGFAGISGNLGFLLATYPFSAWIALTGWRQSFFITGLTIFVLGVLLYFILIHFPRRIVTDPPVLIKKEQKQEKISKQLVRLIKERQAWATFLSHYGIVGTYIGFIGSWAVPYGMEMYDLTRSQSSQLIMIGLIGGLIGSAILPYITNRMGSVKRPLLVVHIAVFLSWITFLLLNGKPTLFLLYFLFLILGFGSGSAPLTFVAIRQYFDIKEVGVASGFANTGGFLSAVLLPSFFGSVLDHYSGSIVVGYHYGFIIPIVFSCCGLIGGFMLKERTRAVDENKKSRKLVG
ncbi:MFS transporter [Bacillus sp. Marseille-P3661]|uniref:MFS transporter n=1 Tax=Bacillus sp. Marseille-P3661 TaxID=1936234 RepID=UPI000C840D17|nr:MFS transporter [Bacillus sp. Marseille-P3661]